MTRPRWRAAILVTLLVGAPLAIGQDSPTASFSASPDGIPASETLRYAIEWRLISAGSARLTWTAVPRSAAGSNELRLHLESAGLVSRLYHVDDDYTAALGQNLCAQNSFTTAHEGSRNKETRTRRNLVWMCERAPVVGKHTANRVGHAPRDANR